jgi:hypothetical protein
MFRYFQVSCVILLIFFFSLLAFHFFYLLAFFAVIAWLLSLHHGVVELDFCFAPTRLHVNNASSLKLYFLSQMQPCTTTLDAKGKFQVIHFVISLFLKFRIVLKNKPRSAYHQRADHNSNRLNKSKNAELIQNKGGGTHCYDVGFTTIPTVHHRSHTRTYS